MEDQVVYWILAGYGSLILWMLSVVHRGMIALAIVQKQVDNIALDLRVFIRTEMDQLKEMANRN